MWNRLSILILSGLVGVSCWAQSSNGSQPGTWTDPQTGTASSSTSSTSSDRDQNAAQSSNTAGKKSSAQSSDESSSNKPRLRRRTGDDTVPDTDEDPGLKSGESSSRSTKIDLSPPPGEAAPPGVGDIGEVQEMKPWDPHKADKNVEVGNYYFKRKNYRAAESRYQEALYWQENSATALFGLAQVEEKLGKAAEARKNYEAYLRILPDGEFAAKAREGLERLKDKFSERSSAKATATK